MLFAMWSVRTRLGLKAKPAYDPDVKAGRLIQADQYLSRVLYGREDTMASHYANGKKAAPEKKSGGLLSGLGELFGLGEDKTPPKPKEKPKDKSKPKKPTPAKKWTPPKKEPPAKASPPKKIEAPVAPDSPEAWRAAAKFVPAKGTEDMRPQMKAAAPEHPLMKAAAPEHPVMKAAPVKAGTVDNYYLLPDGTYFQDDRLPKTVKLKPGTKKLIGYVKGGPLAAGQSAFSVAGKAWNSPTTWYVIGGRVFPGDKIDARSISKGTLIFYKK